MKEGEWKQTHKTLEDTEHLLQSKEPEHVQCFEHPEERIRCAAAQRIAPDCEHVLGLQTNEHVQGIRTNLVTTGRGVATTTGYIKIVQFDSLYTVQYIIYDIFYIMSNI